MIKLRDHLDQICTNLKMMGKSLNEIKRDIALVTLDIECLDPASKHSAILHLKETIDLLCSDPSSALVPPLLWSLLCSGPSSALIPPLP